MRRGCIAVGEINCSGCGRTIKHPERYLIVDREEGTEAEGGKMLNYCVDCCLSRGYASYRVEKGEKVLTLLEEGNQPL